MTHPELLNLAGRIAMAGYFGWATFFNLGSVPEHLKHFRSLGLPLPGLCLATGMAAQFAGATLLIYTPTAAIGGTILILFTLSADLVYHRFWRIHDDPKERITQKLVVYEHLAFCGGLLGLIGPHV